MEHGNSPFEPTLECRYPSSFELLPVTPGFELDHRGTQKPSSSGSQLLRLWSYSMSKVPKLPRLWSLAQTPGKWLKIGQIFMNSCSAWVILLMASLQNDSAWAACMNNASHQSYIARNKHICMMEGLPMVNPCDGCPNLPGSYIPLRNSWRLGLM